MASTNQEVQSSVMASICELFSKLDRKRYSATLKTDDGIINLQIIDKTVKKECVSSPTGHQLHPNDAATRGKGPMLKHGFPNFARGRNANKRHQNRNSAISDSNSIMNSDSTARSKMNYKSPSEKGRDRMRLNRYLYVKNRPETSDNSCQTNLESSNNLTQCVSPDKIDAHCQTSPMSFSSPKPSPNKSETPWFAGCLDNVSIPLCTEDAGILPFEVSGPTSSAGPHEGDVCVACGADAEFCKSELDEYLSEYPVLYGALPPLEVNTDPEWEFCRWCSRDAKWSDLKTCSKCKDFQYCCQSCQISDWKHHYLKCAPELNEKLDLG